MSDKEIPISPLAPEVSPLTEADPNALNELISQRIDDIFNKPPLLLNDSELQVMVEYYRKERQRFMQESILKESKPRAASGPRKAAPKSVAEAIANSADLL
jgi:hypothetical protein